jgi:hypothetical protein
MRIFGWDYRGRRTYRRGWFNFNITQRGLSSITIRPDNGNGIREWWERLSFNTRTNRLSADTPGPGGFSRRIGKSRRRRHYR